MEKKGREREVEREKTNMSLLSLIKSQTVSGDCVSSSCSTATGSPLSHNTLRGQSISPPGRGPIRVSVCVCVCACGGGVRLSVRAQFTTPPKSNSRRQFSGLATPSSPTETADPPSPPLIRPCAAISGTFRTTALWPCWGFSNVRAQQGDL